MSEPEDVLLDGAHHVSTFAARLWRRHVPGPPVVTLPEVRPRLELLVGAIFGDVPRIVAAEAAAPPSFARRVALRIPRHLLDGREYASTDGVRIRLPRRCEAPDGRDAVVARYRLLAVEQAARLTRGTAAALDRRLPAEVRELFLLAEAAAVDRLLARELPGMLPELAAARREALAARPAPKALTPRERRVEALLCELLAAAPAHPPDRIPRAADANASLAWAREVGEAWCTEPGRYRGLPPVALWGRLDVMPDDTPTGRRDGAGGVEPPRPKRIASLRRRPRVRQAADDEDDRHAGLWMIQLDDPQEHVEDPMGLQRPADRDAEKDAEDLADSLAELPEARLVNAPGETDEVLSSEDPPDRRPQLVEPDAAAGGIAYPEWDHRVGLYLPGYAVVRERPVEPGDADWVRTILREHARAVSEVRRRFERLRPRRQRIGRQLDGDDVDIAAWTTAHADGRAGGRVDDRLYEAVRPERRDIAVSLLMDASGSTDSWLSERRRIIDVEKEAVLLVCEALDALGDRYAVTAFSGEGPQGVSLYPVKRFHERYGEAVRLRIAALEHDRYTRMGAALRHATALLSRESARHRLLLLLTDGKPNDVDLYEGRYGIEDTRQAVAEARLQGLHPFCLTVDRAAPIYLARIFGPGGYAVLRRAESLPNALVEVVRRLLRG